MKKFLLLFIVLLFAGTQMLMAQSRKVRGKVLDENGLGLPGAGITIKNTQTGTVTDVDGNFELDVPEADKILVVRAISYATQEVTITGNGVIVHMQPQSTRLNETVVTALAVKREKRELGYTSSTVSGNDLTAGNNVSALSGLAGKVAGANITSSTGGPGGSTRIVLRGEKALSGNNTALLVVDGVIINNDDRTSSGINTNTYNGLSQIDFGNSGNDINPDDIASVTVLEGPAAAALYGAQAGNGAIMITTKSGQNRNKNKKMEVTVKSTYTISDILKYPDLQHTYGQGNIYDGISDDRRENFSWGLPFDGQIRPWGQVINGQQLVKPYSDQPDNVKSFFNKGKTLDNYVSLAGGSPTSSYFLSLDAVNNSGVVPNTFYNKYGIRFNGSTDLGNNFYSSVNINYNTIYSRVEATGQYGGNGSGSVLANLLQTPRDIPIWELKDLNNPFYGYGITDSTGVSRYGYFGAYYKNPYWVAQNYDNRNRTDRVLGDITIGYRKGKMDVFDRVGVDVSSDRSTYETPAYNYTAFDPFYADDPQISTGGYTQNVINSMLFNNDVIATYKTDLSKNVGLDLLGGNNIQMSQTRSLLANIDPSTNGLVIPGFYNFQNAQGPVIVNDGIVQNTTIGIYGDAKINYKRTLYLEVTARNDWNSSLIQNNWSYFYPSLNASWVFTESIQNGKFKDKILDYGKIRAGYASVGNGAPAYANNPPGYLSGNINSSFGSVIFPFNGQPGFTQETFIGDSALRPARTKEYEIGADLSFFKSRVNVSFTYYNDLTVDQITNVPAPPSTGYLSREVNLGDVRNSGEEVTVRITPIHTASGFRWDIFGTYTHNVSIVEDLNGGVSQVQLGGFQGMGVEAAVGHPFGSFYAIDFQRDPQGHVIVDPNTGLPLPTAQPVYKGSYQPRFIASWGTDLSYKGFSLHLLFTAKQGGVYFSENKLNMDFNGTSAETAYNNREPYVFPNSVNYNPTTNTYTPNTTKFSPYQYYTVTEQNVYGPGIVDASYVKLQEAALYYSIPEKLYHRSPFGSLQVGVFGNNLLIWTPKSNQFDDPEETSSGAVGNAQGFNFTARPSLRNYGISIKATF